MRHFHDLYESLPCGQWQGHPLRKIPKFTDGGKRSPVAPCLPTGTVHCWRRFNEHVTRCLTSPLLVMSASLRVIILQMSHPVSVTAAV